ncbi:HET-domain-containing protein [Mollisia scopiformis]|uniref:HET-domain-containing protein n=1 Tax=Mollisia scopiformis TaxID=149040 RepID=A0A194WSU9_MOLSC|nr:HET-domain-containing protein [Mollisia scopiformis]KUJ11028.1 HET-domain-containing protein [Mollisia scopiformis]
MFRSGDEEATLDDGLKIDRLKVGIGTREYFFPSTVDDFVFHVAADPGSCAAINGDVVGRYYGGKSVSDERLQGVRNWLDRCLKHPGCCKILSGTEDIDARDAPLPTRCIEIKGGKIVLQETSDLRGTYVTLSHRWNSSTELCITTMSNLADRQKEVDVSCLSKIFQDAISVTRGLGVRYLWIDSLCIIQKGDNYDDWNRESFKMAQYYQRSILTLAATSGSVEEGLCPTKSYDIRRIVRLPYRDKSGVQRGYFYLYPERNLSKVYRETIRSSELLQRGWVFQEWLLSRRIVCFTPFGTLIECQSRDPRNICGESLKIEIARDDPLPLILKRLFDFDSSNISDLWYTVVEVYSALSLTNPAQDRIKALSGIALEYGRAMKKSHATSRKLPSSSNLAATGEYACGLWPDDLHVGLLWQHKNPCSINQRIEGAPTWSWASITGRVSWNRLTEGRSNTTPACTFIKLITPNSVELSLSGTRGDASEMYSDEPDAPLLSATSSTNECLTGTIFSVNNMINAHLVLRGHLQRILIEGNFHNLDDLRDLPEKYDPLGGVDDFRKYYSRKTKTSSPPQIPTIRFVCLPSLQPDNNDIERLTPSSKSLKEISGWASFEHPDFQTLYWLHENECQILALHASTMGWNQGGFQFGYVVPWHAAFNVLFLQCVKWRRFQRVGVGVLFGKEAERRFREGEEREIVIV